MESILLKVTEIENLGFNYVFIIYDAINSKAILRCSQDAQGFIEETFIIQDFLEYFNKINKQWKSESDKISIKSIFSSKITNSDSISSKYSDKDDLITLSNDITSIEKTLSTEIISMKETNSSSFELFKPVSKTKEDDLSFRKYNQAKFECSSCDKKFLSNDQLKKHNYNVHLQSFSLCAICTKVVRSRKMKDHVTKVHRATKINCPKCPKIFKWQTSLDMHLEDHSAKEAGVSNTFECLKCRNTFVSKVRLRMHERRQCSQPRMAKHSVLCPICGNNYKSNLTLTVHLRIKHSDVGLSGIKPFQNFVCQICDRQFTSKSKLKAHFRSHSGEKPFLCQFCGKAFAYKHYLRNHTQKLTCLQQPSNQS